MLQVSLTPAAVAHRQVSKGWRKFLMTSRGKIGHMDAPAATAEQSGLHHVVAHDMAAHGFLAAKFWQTAAFGDGPHPHYDVVRSEEHTSEPQSIMRLSYAVLCLNKQSKPRA